MVRVADDNKLTRRDKGIAKDRVQNALMFLPNMVKLCGKLLTDSRVATADKALFAGAVVYAIMPLDFIPDFIPFVGQVDDVYLIALTLLRLVNRTDETVVREHWSGGGDIIGLAGMVAKLAPALLPKRVTRVLSTKVELTDAGKSLQNITEKHEPLVKEVAQNEPASEGARG
jgi:uncharacterized membrane protein YkvA (DUF1232 family)